jgi:quinol monooxygenase YgiN
MSEIAYVVRLTAADGKRDEAMQVLGRLVEAAESEPGTLEYVMLADVADPAVIWFYELYADRPGFEAHSTSPTMIEVMGSLGGLLSGPADLREATVVRRKGARV